MKTDFDFDEIGKRTPYRTPDGFFDEAQRKVMEQAGIKPGRRPISRLRLVVLTALTTAAVVAGVLFMPSLWQTTPTSLSTSHDALAIDRTQQSTDPSDMWIQNLSDEELNELVCLSDNDLFLN